MIGIGFYIEWAGLRQASVAWPDIPAMRYAQFNIERGDVEDLGEVVEPTIESRELSPAECIGSLSSAFNQDPDYAHTWHANIAMCAFDSGCPIEVANEGASRFMKLAFGVVTPEVTPEVTPKAQPSPNPTQQENQPVSNSGFSTFAPIPYAPKPWDSAIRDYLTANPEASIPQAIEHLATIDIAVTTEQVALVRDELATDEAEATEPTELPADPSTVTPSTDQPS